MSDKDDSSVEEYIEEIENDLQSKESTVQGEDTDWMLKDVKILLGKEIGMSINNNNSYLVLFVEKGIEKISLKIFFLSFLINVHLCILLEERHTIISNQYNLRK